MQSQIKKMARRMSHQIFRYLPKYTYIIVLHCFGFYILLINDKTYWYIYNK